mgnify:CR=1 FL=1
MPHHEIFSEFNAGKIAFVRVLHNNLFFWKIKVQHEIIESFIHAYYFFGNFSE